MPVLTTRAAQALGADTAGSGGTGAAAAAPASPPCQDEESLAAEAAQRLEVLREMLAAVSGYGLEDCYSRQPLMDGKQVGGGGCASQRCRGGAWGLCISAVQRGAWGLCISVVQRGVRGAVHLSGAEGGHGGCASQRCRGGAVGLCISAVQRGGRGAVHLSPPGGASVTAALSWRHVGRCACMRACACLCVRV